MARPPLLRSLFLQRTYAVYAINHLPLAKTDDNAATAAARCDPWLDHDGFGAVAKDEGYRRLNSTKAPKNYVSDMTPMICHIPQQYTDNPSQAVQSEPSENKINK
ncbi:hypothetical protein C4D60_Mb05t09570 [Musa balbisiana]|uniref:Uncharacterized protein n=1 Tax=Musa balbisiana TaxID=52838 RepID=A0A4S8JUX8_MUSBA|nr:hypothetical protein C4D60_Mb05t09570 [Musa balbisiana]